MQIHKTVFISYRRTNIPIAQAVRLSLMQQGYDVFLDFESINSGSFGQVILNQIAARAHFVLLLTPSALENCVSPDDWVRKEIEEAMKLKRNIIPLLFEGFDFGTEKHHLKGDYLSLLPDYNGLSIYWEYFDEAMNRVRERFLNKPLEMILHPISKAQVEEAKKIQVATDKSDKPTIEQLKAQEYFEKGVAKHKKSDYSGAIDDFSRAILFDEKFAEAYFKRGHSHRNKGNHEQALIDWEQAVAIDPEHSKIHIIRAYILSEKGEFEDALSEAEKALLAQPELDEAYFIRAWVLSDMQIYEFAIIDYSKAIVLNPDNSFTYNNRGSVYKELKDYEHAIADFTKAIELNPDFVLVYNSRGNTYRDMKDYESAIADYNKVIELNPDYVSAYRNRGIAYHDRQDYEIGRAHV